MSNKQIIMIILVAISLSIIPIQNVNALQQNQTSADFLRGLGWTVGEFDSSLKTVCEEMSGSTSTSWTFRTSYDISSCFPLIKELIPDQPMNVQEDKLENNMGYIIFITLL